MTCNGQCHGCAFKLGAEDIEKLLAILTGAQHAAADMGEPEVRDDIIRIAGILKGQRVHGELGSDGGNHGSL